jgi:mRNA-degrading endonuclease RelE of RelBE toxin-antitoxin system
MKQFTLHVSDELARQLRECRASLRAAIRKRLREIVEGAAALPGGHKRLASPKGPPLRFYVSEGYRVSYQVNPVTRTVAVLELRAQSS